MLRSKIEKIFLSLIDIIHYYNRIVMYNLDINNKNDSIDKKISLSIFTDNNELVSNDLIIFVINI